VANPPRSSGLFGSQFSTVISMQSPALARPTNGSTGTPLSSLPVEKAMSDWRTYSMPVGSWSGPTPCGTPSSKCSESPIIWASR
jgi:hypothetical protein